MRYVVGFVFVVLAVATFRVVGCGEPTVDGGTGGMAGTGGEGGRGAGGDGGHGGGTVACVDKVCPCTEAGIRAAIAAGGAQPYTFECGDGKTVVTQAQIVIDNDVTLDGAGMLTIDGNDAHRVFLVSSGTTVELRGITVTGGVGQPPIPTVPPYEFEEGGGIWSKGTLTLDNCAVLGNHAEDFGGGISYSGVLTLMNSTVSENTAGSGAGLRGSGTLVMTNSKVADNKADGAYGGIRVVGPITMTRSEVSGNTAGGPVGGIEGTSLIMVESTVSGNTAGNDGGGIRVFGALTITNSTVSHNTAASGGGGINVGGQAGVQGVLTLTNSTVSYNTAGGGGGIENLFGVLRLTSSTISGNIATGEIGGSAILNQRGRVESSIATLIDGECSESTFSSFLLTSLGHNIESPGDTCGFDQPTDRPKTTVARLNLGELADNGGPTMTHKPGDGGYWEGSLAIDHIPKADCAVDTDQRGEPRPETGGTMCDVGSVEVQP